MRILFVSNYYPPFTRGGYEQWCQEVGTELAKRGHQVSVLTTQAPENTAPSTEDDIPVYRLLHLEVEGGLAQTVRRLLFKERQKLEAENLHHIQKLMAQIQPDRVLIWGMWNVPRSVPALLEQLLPGRVAYYICDYWLSLPNAYIQRWQTGARQKLTQWPKQLLSILFLPQLEREAPIRLKLEHPICVSRAVRDLLVEAGVAVAHADIIYGGTQVEQFTAAVFNRHPGPADGLKLIYVGRLEAEKGLHTIIQAFSLIAANRKNISITLDIYGHGDPDYIATLKTLVQQRELTQQVLFKGGVPRAEIPVVLARYDGLIFSSEWQEPFARTILEAMAAGLVVVGTTTGGTGEILVEGVTGLTFPAGNDQVLADQIQRLYHNPALRMELAQAGQQCVIQNFTFTRMVNQIEAALLNGAKAELRQIRLPISNVPTMEAHS